MQFKKKSKGKSAKTLLIVVAIFLLTHSVDIIYELLCYFGGEDECSFLGPIEVFLFVVNSSINIVIYCVVGSKFRREFWLLLQCECSNGQQRFPGISSVSSRANRG